MLPADNHYNPAAVTSAPPKPAFTHWTPPPPPPNHQQSFPAPPSTVVASKSLGLYSQKNAENVWRANTAKTPTEER